MTKGGTAVLYAPDHIYTEVYRRPPRIVWSSPVPLDILRSNGRVSHNTKEPALNDSDRICEPLIGQHAPYGYSSRRACQDSSATQRTKRCSG
jgi:hypothetical protein